jgi:hypothetical protein
MGDISEFVSNDKAMMDLIANGKFESEFPVMGNAIKFRVLDYEQYAEALKSCSSYDLALKSFVLQREVLRRALISINGNQFPNIDEPAVFLNKLPSILVTYMFNQYEAAKKVMEDGVRDKLDKIKNGSRSQDQEDTGDIAKSSSPTGSTTSSL